MEESDAHSMDVVCAGLLGESFMQARRVEYDHVMNTDVTSLQHCALPLAEGSSWLASDVGEPIQLRFSQSIDPCDGQRYRSTESAGPCSGRRSPVSAAAAVDCLFKHGDGIVVNTANGSLTGGDRVGSPFPARSDSGCEVNAAGSFTPSSSPLLLRHPTAISPLHLSAGSVGRSVSCSGGSGTSPVQWPRPASGHSSPFSRTPSSSLSRNNSDASSLGAGSQHSSVSSPLSSSGGGSCRILALEHHLAQQLSPDIAPLNLAVPATGAGRLNSDQDSCGDDTTNPGPVEGAESLLVAAQPPTSPGSLSVVQTAVSRQQLINSPCPVCGDRISGFHYGIFSCESCKGFFKRTVQNKKNYVCLRGASCAVSIVTRKKCPACRFDKCLKMGMKLEAIREDRTRGGRSTYQCTFPMLSPLAPAHSPTPGSGPLLHGSDAAGRPPPDIKQEPINVDSYRPATPPLLREIRDVEYLWHRGTTACHTIHDHTLTNSTQFTAQSTEVVADYTALCNLADHKLYKIVKWCKSLPVFRSIHIDDQTVLLINTWCQLLLLTCCFRSVDTPGKIRISHSRELSADQATSAGVRSCVERMLSLTEQLRRLKVDYYEYLALKVIVLLSCTGDIAVLKEPQRVAAARQHVLHALQTYTMSHYPHMASKFGELLLRIPDIERACQLGKELMGTRLSGLSSQQGASEESGDAGNNFDILFELLRGD